jgi:hypothetical protein
MKSLLIQSLSLCALGTALLAANSVLISDSQQVRLPLVAAMAEDTAQAVKVPGNNNATYGPVPQAEQLLDIEFLDMAPSPIPVYAHSILPAISRIDKHTANTVPVTKSSSLSSEDPSPPLNAKIY